ncbi:MAG: lamin tail domain-containing protein [bacterium]
MKNNVLRIIRSIITTITLSSLVYVAGSTIPQFSLAYFVSSLAAPSNAITTRDWTPPTTSISLVGIYSRPVDSGWYQSYSDARLKIVTEDPTTDVIHYQILAGNVGCPANTDPLYSAGQPHNTNLSSEINALLDGVYTLCYFGTDPTGNIETIIHPQLLQLDTTAPTSPIFWVEEDTTSVKLDWKSVVGEGGYDLYRSLDNITFTLLADTGNVLTYVDSTVLANSNYYYKVVSYDLAGNDSGVGLAIGRYAGTKDIVIDDDSMNIDLSSSGTVSKSGPWGVYHVNNAPDNILANAVGGDNYSAPSVYAGQTYTWTTNSDLYGYYDVYVAYICDSVRGTASYDVYSGTTKLNSSPILVNQSARSADGTTPCGSQSDVLNESRWHKLGSFRFTDNAEVRLVSGTGSYQLADAVGFSKTADLEDLRITTYSCPVGTASSLSEANRPDINGNFTIPAGCNPVSGYRFGQISPNTAFSGTTGNDGILNVPGLTNSSTLSVGVLNSTNDDIAGDNVVIGLMCSGGTTPITDNYDNVTIPPENAAYCSAYVRGPVVINEFLPNPTGADDAPMPAGEWIELYNNSNSAVNVAGWWLYDDTNTHELAINASNTNTGNTIIPAKGYLVVYRNGDPDFALDNTTADTVRLYAGTIGSGARYVDSYRYTTFKTVGLSYARFPDGTGNFIDPDPTPGEPNVATTSSPLVYDEENVVVVLPTTTIDFSLEDHILGFSVFNLAPYKKFTYTLTYQAGEIQDGIFGEVVLSEGQTSYVKNGITLGTCSTGGTCVYLPIVNNFNLSIDLEDAQGLHTIIGATE